MPAIRTILCPVDFSPATERQLAMAVDLCRAFRARLVLHHNIPSATAGAGIGWMWAEKHHPAASEVVEERQLQQLLDRVAVGIDAEARVTHGSASPAVAAVAEAVNADLVVLTTHLSLDDDHTSVTEQVLAHVGCAVLALHEASVESRLPRFDPANAGDQAILVPTDFTAESTPAVEVALDLARRLSLEVHLLHVAPAQGPATEPQAATAEAARQRLGAMVPGEIAERVRLHLAVGDPAHEIAAAAERLGAACIVMGEHARSPLRRWFTRDTSRQVLHQARCPIWYVPGRTA